MQHSRNDYINFVLYSSNSIDGIHYVIGTHDIATMTESPEAVIRSRHSSVNVFEHGGHNVTIAIVVRRFVNGRNVLPVAQGAPDVVRTPNYPPYSEVFYLPTPNPANDKLDFIIIIMKMLTRILLY